MEKKKFDVVILGAGPGGLSAAQYSARAGLKTAILENMVPGGQTITIDHIENYPGMDATTGFELAQKFQEQAEKFGAKIFYSEAKSIEKKNDLWLIDSTEGLFECSSIIIATGAKPRKLNVPGEEEFQGRGVSYCATCDGPLFRDKKILVIGGGDSAVQETMYLAKLSSKITIIHRRDRFRAQQAIVEALEKEKNVEIRLNTTPIAIEGTDKVNSVTLKDLKTEKEYKEEFDGVFVFIGHLPQTQLFPDLKKDKAGFIETNDKMETSIDGIFAVGDVRNTPFRQIVTAASDGAVAAHFANEFIDRLKGNEYPGRQ